MKGKLKIILPLALLLVLGGLYKVVLAKPTDAKHKVDGQVYGFANCVVHENTWETQAICYLEDLYVTPSARGHGIGRALIEWLRNAMRAEGWARLYWHTRQDNERARKLYDRFAEADDFVRYVIRQK